MPANGGGGGGTVMSVSLSDATLYLYIRLYIGSARTIASARNGWRGLPAIAVILGLALLSLGDWAGAAEEAPAPATSAPAVAAPVAAPNAAPVTAPGLVRVSSSFEAKHAAAVLRQVAKLFGAGFVRKDAERIAAEIDVLPAEQSRVWEFSAVQKGRTYALRVRARLDEFGDVDLDFFSAPEIASAVRGAVDRYLNARGL
jgi:hypothetical protein